MEPFLLISCLVTGVCVAGIALTSRESYGRAIDLIQNDLNSRLRTIRLNPQRMRTRINAWVTVVALTFFALWVGMDNLPFAVLGAILMAAGPWYLVRRLGQKRQQRIEDQMASAMVTFSSAIRAGLSLPQALEMLANETPSPICEEFQHIIGEYHLGKPLERTLHEAKERLRTENFVLFAAAILASRESGGRLNETVERISQSVQELQRLERKIMAETAQARKSAVYMALVPLFLLVVYYFVNPTGTMLLFKTVPGQILLSIAMILNLIAYFWARKILNVDI